MLVPTVGLYYFNVAVIFILLLISFAPLYKGKSVEISSLSHANSLFYAINFLLITLFLVFQFTESDYWGYMNLFYDNVDLPEPLQNWIRSKFDDFYIWRLAVWGGAFIVFLLIFKRLDLNPRVFFPLFVLCYLPRFISREQLGIAIMFLGSTYLLKPIRLKKLSYVLGVLLILVSYFFHNSMVVSIGMLIPAFFRVDIKIARLILILFVPLIFFVNYLLSGTTILSAFEESSTGVDKRIAIYSELEVEAYNIKGLIRQFIYWSPIVLMLFDVIVRSSRKGLVFVLPSFIRYYLNYWFYMFVLSFIFYWQSSSLFVSVRFLDKSLFPMVLVLSYWFAVQKPNKKTEISLWLFLISLSINYLYLLYKA